MLNEEKIREETEFTLECLSEDAPIRGNAMASGDDEYDRKVEDEIIADLEAGNEWAWCLVKVTARWQHFEGTNYLGGCSYWSREDFQTPDGYWPGMQNAAFEDLLRQVERADLALEKVRE